MLEEDTDADTDGDSPNEVVGEARLDDDRSLVYVTHVAEEEGEMEAE